MRTISKPAIGIISIIAISLIIAGISWYWRASVSGLTAALASIGGMVVILGLMMEREAEKEGKKEHLSTVAGDARRLEIKTSIGWWILIIGIVVEIVTGAGLAAYEFKENRTISRRAKEQLSEKLAYLETGTIEVVVFGNDPEAEPVAGNLVRALRSAGCFVKWSPRPEVDTSDSGILFVTRTPFSRPTYAKVIFNILKEDNIACAFWDHQEKWYGPNGVVVASFGTNDLVIIVSRRPLGDDLHE